METSQRFASGLAFNPEREMRLFAIQARKGRRLTGISLNANGWLFEEAEPENPAFDIAYRDEATDEYFQTYADAGWEHVVSEGRLHVFRAPEGTERLAQGLDSRIAELKRLRNRHLMTSGISVVGLVVLAFLLKTFNLGDAIEAILFAVIVFPAAFAIIPLFSYSMQLARLSKRS